MARNPRPKLPNLSTLYLARTGGGKSQALKQNPAIPAANQGARVILWDPARDHEKLDGRKLGTNYYSDRIEFLRVLSRAHESGKGYRIAYDGERSVDLFEWFCRVVWAVLDGRWPTFVLVEELNAVCPHSAEAPPDHARLVREGRKYGLQFHATSQRPQEISKTDFENCATWWIGPQKAGSVQRFSKELGVPEPQIRALQPLQFFVWHEADLEPKRVNLAYRD